MMDMALQKLATYNRPDGARYGTVAMVGGSSQITDLGTETIRAIKLL